MKPREKKGIIQTTDTSLIEMADVIAIGPEVKHIAIGDTLLFTSFGVDSIDLGTDRHYFILENDDFILAKYVETE